MDAPILRAFQARENDLVSRRIVAMLRVYDVSWNLLGHGVNLGRGFQSAEQTAA